jgi:phosphoglycerate dehydrogenase-like enzyme
MKKLLKIVSTRWVDGEDLAEALKENKLQAGGVDVVSAEPIAASHPLLTSRNVFITPYLAGATRRGLSKTYVFDG